MSVKHAILALLYRKPMHGYEIGRLLAGSLNIDWDIKPAQIAATLARLAEAGPAHPAPLVSCEIAPGDDAPDRKVYRLTDAGLDELHGWYQRADVRDYRLGDTFYIKLLFSLIGGPVAPEHVITAQRRVLYQELHSVTDMRRTTDPRTNLPLVLLLDSATMHLEADIRWMDMVEARLPDLKQYTPPPLPQRPRGRPRREATLRDEG